MAAQNLRSIFSKPPLSLSSSKLVSNTMYLLLISSLLPMALHHLSALNFDQMITKINLHDHLQRNAVAAAIIFTLTSTLTAAVYLLLRTLRPKKVYLVDFACYKHHPSSLISREDVVEKVLTRMSTESAAFTTKVLDKSGVSSDTYSHDWQNFPPECSWAAGRAEAETVISGAVDDLLAKTGVNPPDIGVVIVNISTFNPVPSLSAMIVNRYKLREDVLSYNLGGMGCSAGIIAVDLAKRLLQLRRNTYALIMSLECPTSSIYLGDDRSKLVPMCLFRMGGAAVLLSNRPSDRRLSKYELTHTLRTHLGADDRAYNCVIQEPDKAGKVGITLSKTLMSVAGEALKSNITALGPLVLPISEQIIFLVTLIARKGLKIKGIKPYVPDFKQAFEHFCVHAGGKGVLDEVEKRLKLTTEDMEASRMTLYRYSNTSSSSLWYELAYAEAKGRVKKGDRVWQIGFGSGFKCGSSVWRALRSIDPDHENNPWTDVIRQFPVSFDDRS